MRPAGVHGAPRGERGTDAAGWRVGSKMNRRRAQRLIVLAASTLACGTLEFAMGEGQIMDFSLEVRLGEGEMPADCWS